MQIFYDFVAIFFAFFLRTTSIFPFLLHELDEFLSSDVKNDGPALDAMSCACMATVWLATSTGALNCGAAVVGGEVGRQRDS